MAEPSWPKVLASKEMKDKIASAKVLCVGTGGIGCELLKTLVMTGFRDIETVDLDTIETSNLNRQFLFRKRHVGSSKAQTAAEVVQRMRAGASVVAYQANIKEHRYDVDFFRRFSLVLNGLDNLEARRHVNRMCLAAGVPLVESGTAGYLGQVTVHVKGETECFECTPKPVPKSYPICTIRNTPDKPIHCVVWAKELLFARLFGPSEAATDLDTAEANGAADANGGEQQQDGAAAAAEDLSVFKRREGEAAAGYAARVFDHVFGSDVARLAGVDELWKMRARPTPIFLKDALPQGLQAADADGSSNSDAAAAPLSACKALRLTDAHSAWGVADCARVFVEATRMYMEGRPNEVGQAVFDKDDELAVEFVTAAANLRAACYGIPTQSLFVTKGMAGNIIHAIATTNAIVGGLIVAEALKLLAGCSSSRRATYLLQHLSNKRLLNPVEESGPSPGCMVCGKAQVGLVLDTVSTTLQQLIDKVVKGRLAVSCPTLMCSDFLYEEGEGLEPDEVEANAALLPRSLAGLPGGGVRHGSLLEVQDQTQSFRVVLVIAHQASIDEEQHPEGVILQGNLPTAAEQQAEADAAAAAAEAGAGPSSSAATNGAGAVQANGGGGNVVVDDDDDVIIVTDRSRDGRQDAKGKRPMREEDSPMAEEGRRSKRARTAVGSGGGAGDDDAVIILD